MPRRVMFVHQKTGYNLDQGPSWIGWVEFNRSWGTARYRDRELRRTPGLWDANFVDAETGDEFWLSGPKRDQSDTRYGARTTTVDADVRDVYEAFLGGDPLPGREHG
ncbi:MAG TPA: hypothetical protein VIM01_15450 [Dermatophilaceae bacterium]|jgi:hypothetical protein